MMMTIRQGDAYAIEITLETDEGTLITPEIVHKVEVMLGAFQKIYPGSLIYDGGVWVYPMSQAETQALAGPTRLEVRVKFADDTVAGEPIGTVLVLPMKSKEVL